jgi:hypothetical protein
MKKIKINLNKNFEIAQLLKKTFPNTKIYLFLKNKKNFIIKLPKTINDLTLKELQLILKNKYPNYFFQFIYY